MNYKEESLAIKEEIISYRQHFHMYPELSSKEYATVDFISQELTKSGIEIINKDFSPQTVKKVIYTKNKKETVIQHSDKLPGVVGLLKGTTTGRTVALRADMDALALEECNDINYKSRNKGIMHGCGHDAHMAMVLGAAKLLAKHKGEFTGNIKFIFQSAEETVGGASSMIRDGVLTNPNVDAIFALHVDPSYEVGQIGLKYEETTAFSDRLIIKLFGEGSHGATPHLGTDTVMIASYVIVAFQSFMSRFIDPLEPAVLSFGIVQGGNQPNALANQVIIKGMLRTFNNDTREKIIWNINNILKDITDMYHAQYEFTREISNDGIYNPREYVDFVKEIAGKIILPSNIYQMSKPRTTCEDFAYFLKETGGAYFFLGTNNSKPETRFPLHSPHFDIDERALAIGTALLTSLCIEFLKI